MARVVARTSHRPPHPLDGVVALAYVIPGPDMAVILRSATRSPRAGMAAALGAQAGLCVHMVLAVAGLSVILARYPEALTTIRITGGLYLLYLGGRLILPTLRRARGAPPAREDDVSTRSAFGQGLFTNVLNPKAVLFFAAVLPQFLAPGAAPTWLQVLALGVLDIGLGFVAWAVVVVVVARGHIGTRRWDATAVVVVPVG